MRTNGSHWTDDELLQRAYGLEPEASAAHLEECANCAARWNALQQKRQAVCGAAPGGAALEARLREQRQAVWNRIEKPQQPMLWRAVPVAAMALLLVVGVSLQRPAPTSVSVQISAVKDMSDEQLFTEIASVANEESPRASEPIRGLFSESSSVEAQ